MSLSPGQSSESTCPRCGATIPAGALACVGCGTMVTGAAIDTAVTMDPLSASNLVTGASDRGTSPGSMVIDAKIGAEESENQLEAYDDWIGANLRNCLVTRIFLTPEGRKPDTAREDWKCLSFLEVASIFR